MIKLKGNIGQTPPVGTANFETGRGAISIVIGGLATLEIIRHLTAKAMGQPWPRHFFFSQDSILSGEKKHFSIMICFCSKNLNVKRRHCHHPAELHSELHICSAQKVLHHDKHRQTDLLPISYEWSCLRDTMRNETGSKMVFGGYQFAKNRTGILFLQQSLLFFWQILFNLAHDQFLSLFHRIQKGPTVIQCAIGGFGLKLAPGVFWQFGHPDQ